MLRTWVLNRSALRICALICLSLLLAVTFFASIHKHDTGQDASCLFCHATTRAEWQTPDGAAKQAFDLVSLVMDKYTGAALADPERAIRIPRAPPTKLLSL